MGPMHVKQVAVSLIPYIDTNKHVNYQLSAPIFKLQEHSFMFLLWPSSVSNKSRAIFTADMWLVYCKW